MKIDSLCDAIVNADGSFEQVAEKELPDPMTKLVEDGALAAALGGGKLGHARVERLEAAVPVLHKRETASEWDAPLTDGGSLEKSFHAAARRAGLREWMQGEIARGSTVSELVAYAKRGGDVDRAREIALIGEEL